MRNYRQTGVLSLFLTAGLAFCLIFLIGVWLEKSESPENFYSDFKKKILEAEKETKRRNNLISENLGLLRNFEELEVKLSGLSKKADFQFSDFFFQNDSLAWWNDHLEIINSELSEYPSGEFHAINQGGGWVGYFCTTSGLYKVLTIVKIKKEYPVHNRFLEDRFETGFPFSSLVKLTAEKSPFPVSASDGKTLFYLDLSSLRNLSCRFDGMTGTGKFIAELITVFLFLMANLLFYLALFKLFKKISNRKINRNLSFFLFCMVILFSRYMQSYLKFPSLVYELDLFRPLWYSSSLLLPSPGEMVLLLIIFVWLGVILYKDKELFQRQSGNRLAIPISVVAWTSVLIIVHGLAANMISSLVLDSAFPVNFRNIAAFSPISVIGLLIIILVNVALSLFSMISLRHIFSVFREKVTGMVVAGLTILTIITWIYNGTGTTYNLSLLSITGFALLYRFLFYKNENPVTLQPIIWSILWLSFLNTLILDTANQTKTDSTISLYALKLASGHNPVTEQKYDEVSGKIAQDSDIKRIVFADNLPGASDSLNQYIKKHYFQDFWTRYNVQITLCRPGNQLLIQPQLVLNDCRSYFDNLIQSYGTAASTKGLYCLDYGYGLEYYLGVINFNKDNKSEINQTNLYIEFTVNGTVSEPGYPSLLLEKENDNIPGLRDFSYAIYRQGSLVHSVGNLLYPMELPRLYKSGTLKIKSEHNGEVNYHFKINPDTELLVGYKYSHWLSFFTQVSYLFILFAFTAAAITGFTFLHRGFHITGFTLRMKLQWLLTGMILLTMIVLGIIQIDNIIKINQIKNDEYLREKGFSVKTEFQHKFGGEKNLTEIVSHQPENFLLKIANVFFTDVNFYDPAGKLLASSRMRIFKEGLISDRMNPVALKALRNEKKPLVIISERIGNLSFSSAYIPLQNDDNELLGYIHLPYFARQDALKNEITSFLVTFANIYIFLILAGVIISVLISNYLTSSLVILSGKLNSMNPGGKNEKISWTNQDEIGALVGIYNRKVEELEYNVQKLTAAEREKAWRTMARQVAHEIKNPLTPMKLSAQYLQKAAQEGAPDLEQRIEKFTKQLVEQIDELAVIASDFSMFAKIPDPVPESFNLAKQIESILQGYPDSELVNYSLKIYDGNYEIYTDRSRFTRIVTNLVNNATQAIESGKPGRIEVSLERLENCFLLAVKDNGSGIMPESADHIFQPEFTTKSGGMGLGLAIVKEMVQDMKGEIRFESVPGQGSEFFVKIPADA